MDLTDCLKDAFYPWLGPVIHRSVKRSLDLGKYTNQAQAIEPAMWHVKRSMIVASGGGIITSIAACVGAGVLRRYTGIFETMGPALEDTILGVIITYEAAQITMFMATYENVRKKADLFSFMKGIQERYVRPEVKRQLAKSYAQPQDQKGITSV